MLQSQIKLTSWSWGRQWFRQRPPSTREEKKKKKRAGGVWWTHSHSGIVRSSLSSSSSMFRCGMAQDWLLQSAVATGAHSLPEYCSSFFSPVVPDGRGDFGVQCSHALSVGRGACNFVWIIWRQFPAFYWLGAVLPPVIENFWKMYSLSGHPWCRWVCFFIRTDFSIDTFSIRPTSIAHQ